MTDAMRDAVDDAVKQLRGAILIGETQAHTVVGIVVRALAEAVASAVAAEREACAKPTALEMLDHIRQKNGRQAPCEDPGVCRCNHELELAQHAD